jgi:hypothetical protein
LTTTTTTVPTATRTTAADAQVSAPGAATYLAFDLEPTAWMFDPQPLRKLWSRDRV